MAYGTCVDEFFDIHDCDDDIDHDNDGDDDDDTNDYADNFSFPSS